MSAGPVDAIVAPIDAIKVLERAALDASTYRELLAGYGPFAAFGEIEKAIAAVREVVKKLRLAVRQNDHDMVLTGEELRQCYAALAAFPESKQ